MTEVEIKIQVFDIMERLGALEQQKAQLLEVRIQLLKQLDIVRKEKKE